MNQLTQQPWTKPESNLPSSQVDFAAGGPGEGGVGGDQQPGGRGQEGRGAAGEGGPADAGPAGGPRLGTGRPGYRGQDLGESLLICLPR